MKNVQCILCKRYLRVNNIRIHYWVRHTLIMDKYVTLISSNNNFFSDTDKIIDLLTKEKLMNEVLINETKMQGKK